MDIYYIGTPEKIQATLKGLKTLGKELSNSSENKTQACPTTPRRKCPRLKTLHRNIRDKKDEINENYEKCGGTNKRNEGTWKYSFGY